MSHLRVDNSDCLGALHPDKSSCLAVEGIGVVVRRKTRPGLCSLRPSLVVIALHRD